MSPKAGVSLRVVFDTNVVLSALLFREGRLSWLRPHWIERACTPLLSCATAGELARVLSYPKFGLSQADAHELLGDYVPYCEIVDVKQPCPVQCRDSADQRFLDLAYSGKAQLVVSGHRDLLQVAPTTELAIVSPETYAARFCG